VQLACGEGYFPKSLEVSIAAANNKQHSRECQAGFHPRKKANNATNQDANMVRLCLYVSTQATE
jgi:hypothetical protein